MEVVTSRDNVAISVRAQPGEDLFEVLFAAVRHAAVASAALVSVAGSAEHLTYGVVSTGDDGIPRYTDVVTIDGPIEITGLQGHVGFDADGGPTCHVHGNFGLSDGSVVAGHVYSARVLVTIEMTLLGSRDTTWLRSVEKYRGDHVMPILLPLVNS